MPDEKALYYEYLFHNLDARYEEMRRLSTGDGGRGGLNLKLLSSIKVMTPSLSEQARISGVLRECDNEIELQSKKLSALQRQKKGLMERLLTGQVRVKIEK